MSNITQTKPGKPTTIKGWIESPDFRGAIAKALPKHLTPDRFLRVALTATLKTPKLLECTPESVMQCLLQCGQLGIEPDGRRAHLIPFKSTCTLVVDYKGLVELAMRSGMVSYLHADVVRRGDVFKYSLGQVVDHIPWFLRLDEDKPSEAGEDIAVYAIARMKDGSTAAAVMSIDEVYAIRDNSQGYKAWKNGIVSSSTWDPKNWVAEQEMKKKTALRRLTKMLPLSPEFRDAVDVDDDEVTKPEINVTPEAGNGATPRFRKPEPHPLAPAKPEPIVEFVAETAPEPTPEPTPAPVVEEAHCNVISRELDAAGVTFSQFQAWAIGERYKGADTWSCVDEIPNAVAGRLAKSIAAVIAAVKGGAQ